VLCYQHVLVIKDLYNSKEVKVKGNFIKTYLDKMKKFSNEKILCHYKVKH